MYKEAPFSFLASVLLILLLPSNSAVHGLAYTCKGTTSARNTRRKASTAVKQRIPWQATTCLIKKKQQPPSIICNLLGNDSSIHMWRHSSRMVNSASSTTKIQEQGQGIVPEGGLGSPCIIKVRI